MGCYEKYPMLKYNACQGGYHSTSHTNIIYTLRWLGKEVLGVCLVRGGLLNGLLLAFLDHE